MRYKKTQHMNNENNNSSKLIEDSFSMELIDGVIHCAFNIECPDKELIETGIKMRLEISSNKPYPMISDLRKVKVGVKSARDRLSEKDGLKNLSALAIIYRNYIHLTLISLYQVFYKPEIPVKYFKNKKQALVWIQKYKNNN